MPIWQQGIWICWSSRKTSKHLCALSQFYIIVINMFLCRNMNYYVTSVDNPVKTTDDIRSCSHLLCSWCAKMGFVKILGRNNLEWSVPVVMPTAGIACKSLFITWLCFAWGNVLACAKMIAKMRRQGQRPILFYVLLLAVGPWGMQKFCMYFLQVNFLWGCLLLRWWEKGWGLRAVQLEEHCRKLLMCIIGLWREESDKELFHNLEPQHFISFLSAHLQLLMPSLNEEAFPSKMSWVLVSSPK